MPPKEERQLVRELGFGEALSIGLGTMIGAGIFVLSALAAQQAGPAATLSYLLAGLVCLPTAVIVSELATGLPQAGGSYHLISQALGPLAGAVVGPGNWLGLVFACGFYLIGFAQYLSAFLPIPPWITVLIAGAFFIFLNYRGARSSGRLQKTIVLLLVAILGLFVVWGWGQVDPALHRPFFPVGWGPVLANIGVIIVSFTGFEKVSTMAEEVRDPGRTLPRAIVGSVLIATALYCGVLFVTTGVLPWNGLAALQAPLVAAAQRFMGGVGAVAMTVAALLATASSANAAIMASARINFAMGRDGILPAWFNAVHPRRLTPYRSIVTTGGLAILLALSGRAESLAEISSALFMVSYVLIALGLLVMRRAQPATYRPAYRVPGYPWIAFLGIALPMAVVVTMSPLSRLLGAGLVAINLLWYVVWGRRHAQVRGILRGWFVQERPVETLLSRVERSAERGRTQILVPVANPATAKSLIRVAAMLARGHEGTTVAALSVVPVPDHLPLEMAQSYLEAHEARYRDILRRAAKHGALAGIRLQMLLRAAHGVASGIVGVAEARPQTRLILLGWHGPLTLGRIRSSVDKQVLRRAPCDVAVLLDRGLEQVRRVLVPVGGGPHARLALRLAQDIVAGEGGQVTVLHVQTGSAPTPAEEAQRGVRRIVEAELGTDAASVRVRVRRAPGVVAGIVEEAHRGPYDLLIIGASEEWVVRHWLVGAIPDVVAERAPCSVLLVRNHEFVPLSLVRRWLYRRGRRR